MRVLTVLVALVATPFVVSLAQSERQHNVKEGRDERVVRKSSGQRAATLRADADDCNQQGQNEGTGCAGDPPPPPVTPPKPVLGQLSGTVFFDASGLGVKSASTPGISGWVILLSGAVSASTMTDASGNYSFTGLASGTYTVCRAGNALYFFSTAPASGPTCPFGLGYSVTLSPGQSVPGLDFGSM